jgi:RimJ/RimL family protein N-acetyltransferase
MTLAMLFAPEQTLLKSGRPCTIRQATMEDVAALLTLEQAIVRARAGVIKHEDELPSEVAVYADRVRSRLCATDGSALMLVAEVDGAIVGEASLERIGFRMLRHVGVVSIGTHPSTWGRGVGRALLERLLQWARTHRDADGGRVLRVELYTRADNARGLALYRALGFTLEGVRRRFVRRDDGTFVDDLVMGLLLEEADAT